MNCTEKTKLPKHVTAISFLTLLVFIVAFFSHSVHLNQYNNSVEQQGCHFCQQGLDNPPKIIELLVILQLSFINAFVDGISQHSDKPYYGSPRLRAPPYA